METATPTAAQLLESIKNQARRAVYDERDDSAHFEQFHWVKDEAIRQRILIERAIVRRAVRDIVAAGYMVRVHDGETWATGLEKSVDAVMAEIGQCDEERLYVWNPSTTPGQDGNYAGSIFLVYGNDGWDVMADHTDSPLMHELLAEANRLADLFGDLL